MARPNFRSLAEQALLNIDAVLSHFLPGGKKEGHEYIALNPTRSDNKLGSFKVNTQTGRCSDFATNDKGGDLVSLVAYLDGGKQRAAADRVATFLGIPGSRVKSDTGPRPNGTRGEYRLLSPIPEGAIPIPPHHKELGNPPMFWVYCNTQGQPLALNCRFEAVDGSKEFRPVTWWERPSDGRVLKLWRALPEPRPLYNLEMLAENPEAKVIIVEGEKACDAAYELSPPKYTPVSPWGGAMAPGKTDWTPLTGRQCLIWPDNDKAGAQFAAEVIKLLKGKAKEVRLLNLDAFKTLPDGSLREVPAKWDAADALAEGYTPELLSKLLADPANTPEPPEKKPKKVKNPQFEVNERGVWFRESEDDKPVWVCSELLISARTRSSENLSWGYLLEWNDADGQHHVWSMPSEMTSGRGDEYRRTLLDGGLIIAPGNKARERLESYILTARPDRRVRCVNKTGWHDGFYVLPDRTIDDAENSIIYQSPWDAMSRFRERGTLDEWKTQVGALCRGNSRLLFFVSVGFAAVLLEFTADENGFFHLRGASSSGKTSVLHAARSTFGGPDFLRNWRATDNALESVASAHNHALLPMDELSQVDPRKAGEVSYMTANGVGKARSTSGGGTRPILTWRLLGISSGEVFLADYMNEAGRRVKAGQEARMLDIPADAGKGMGCFEDLHGHTSGAKFADALRRAADEQHGTAIIAFIKETIKDMNLLPAAIKGLKDSFVQKLLEDDRLKNVSGQGYRALERFGLVAAAGEYATRLGITGWKQGEVKEAAEALFMDWLESRGGASNQEETAMLEQVKHFFELHGESRFTQWDMGLADESKTFNRAGFRKNNTNGLTEYFVLPGAFKNEVCAGFNSRDVAKLLVEKGLITPDPDDYKAASRNHRLPGMPGKRSYYFPAKDDEEEK